MSFRRLRSGRDIRIASREDPLRLFLGNYRLTACCRRLDALTVATFTRSCSFGRSGQTPLSAASALGFGAIAAGCEVPGSRRGIPGRWRMADKQVYCPGAALRLPLRGHDRR
jgi:hypothetical protein